MKEEKVRLHKIIKDEQSKIASGATGIALLSTPLAILKSAAGLWPAIGIAPIIPYVAIPLAVIGAAVAVKRTMPTIKAWIQKKILTQRIWLAEKREKNTPQPTLQSKKEIPISEAQPYQFRFNKKNTDLIKTEEERAKKLIEILKQKQNSTNHTISSNNITKSKNTTRSNSMI
jgi:hypothetical protein